MPEPQMMRRETLADRLKRSPLPLPYALRCATDMAAALRELHERGTAHGAVEADRIHLNANGATLECGEDCGGTIDGDIAAFGAVLEEMLTGGEEVGETSAPRRSRAGVRNTALRLAARCRNTSGGEVRDMRQVVTEIRLLAIQVTQYPAHEAADRGSGPRGIAARREAGRMVVSATRQRSAPPRVVDSTGNRER